MKTIRFIKTERKHPYVTFYRSSSYLLKKNRFFCKSCERSFITKKVLLLKVIVLLLNNRKQILVKSAETQTISSIARNCSVSVSTVQRIINEEVKRFKFSYQTFPQHFSMVECNYGKVIEYVKAETS